LSDEVTSDEKKEVVEERVKPTVIRRRTKVVKTPAPEVEAKEAETEGPLAGLDAPVTEPVENTALAVEEVADSEKTPDVNDVPVPPKETDDGRKQKKITVEIDEDNKPASKKKGQFEKKKEVVNRQALLNRRDTRYDRGGRKKKKSPRGSEKQTEITVPKAIKMIIKISEFITVGDIAHRMGIKSSEVIRKLIGMGMMATVNQSLDIDTATLIATDFGFEVESVALEMDTILDQEEIKEEELRPRPPVVTIMGHVDHGKTTLLDSIRQTDVTAGESGGITQHIGAYDVRLDNGDVVFLDTPGHEAFTAMRSRGAQVTDIVVLVVAADDGVMPQTVEAIDHARAARVPIIVAVNKIDKPDANPDKIKQELSKHELISEDWGGDTIFCEVSAKARTGIKELLEIILLQAEIMELKAAPERHARGAIIEAKLDKGRGPVATVLVQNGTLRLGDNFVTGIHTGKVRGLFDDKGRKVKEAGPSIPVEVVGLSGVPDAGDDFVVLAEERVAKQISMQRAEKSRNKELAKSSKVTLDQLFDRIQAGEFSELNVVLKADVHGSIEAITESLHKLSTDKVKIRVIHSGVGGITESDILLASASNAIVIGFHVRPSIKATRLAEAEKVEIDTYNIIYDVVNDVRAAMEGMLSPVIKEVYLGRAEIRETYNVSKVGTIAGSYVVDGKMLRNAEVRVLRDNVVVFEGKLASLKRFADDAKEVQSNYECGMSIENFNDIKVGDVVEAFTHKEEAAIL